ncbi:MAG: tetratricopeptide repeat protein [Verrucomicrobiota bacterium]
MTASPRQRLLGVACRAALGILVLATILPRPLGAQESLADLTSFRLGSRALVDERFETAASQLASAWDSLIASEAGANELSLVRTRLLEAWVRDGQHSLAAQWLDQNLPIQPGPSELHWIAVIYLTEERFTEAITACTNLLLLRPENRWALFNRSIALARAGKVDEAFAGIEETTPTNPEEAFALTRLAIAANRPDFARQMLEWAGTQPTIDSAEMSRLERLIEFGEVGPPVRFSEDTPPSVQDDLELVDRDSPQAASFARALANYEEGRFAEAASTLKSLAEGLDGEARRIQLFNQALVALGEGQDEQYGTIRGTLQRSAPNSPLLIDLDFIEAIRAGDSNEARAIDALDRLIRDHPEHPAAVEARIELAQLYLNQVPARPQSARVLCEKLRDEPLTVSQAERRDLVSIWVEQIDGKLSEVVERSTSFLEDWPGSSFRPSVAMLLASAHEELGHRLVAGELFEEIAREYPDAPFADAAQFFALKAAPASPETVPRWETYAEASDGFGIFARFELGHLLISLDRFAEARSQFQNIIDLSDPEDEASIAARADRGHSFYLEALRNRSDRATLEQASKAFTELITSPQLSRRWRYEAIVREGQCREALGENEAALDRYLSIFRELNEDSSLLQAPLSIEANEWLFRAGFAAIDLLTEAEEWRGAIQIADRLSQIDSIRSADAAQLSERLRLKHWVWE